MIDPVRQLRLAALPTTRPGGPTSSVVILRALSAAIRARGSDPVGFLAKLGLSAEALADVEGRLPFATMARAWDLAADWVSDPNFGIHLASRLPRGSFDLVEYVTRSCATYGDALRYFARYYPLLEDAAEITVETRGGVAWVVHRLNDSSWPSPRQGVEMMMAGWVERGRKAIGKSFILREACFRHALPRDLSEHRKLFGRRLRFGAPFSGLAFDSRWLEVPLPTADGALLHILKRQAETQLAHLPADPGLVQQTRRALVRAMDGHTVALAAVAKMMGVSRRGLQRGLAAEGTSFQGLTSQVRKELALAYLTEGQRTAAESPSPLGSQSPAPSNGPSVAGQEQRPGSTRSRALRGRR